MTVRLSQVTKLRVLLPVGKRPSILFPFIVNSQENIMIIGHRQSARTIKTNHTRAFNVKREYYLVAFYVFKYTSSFFVCVDKLTK